MSLRVTRDLGCMSLRLSADVTPNKMGWRHMVGLRDRIAEIGEDINVI
jgi:hypothetical protein